jgi:hypothetical protein
VRSLWHFAVFALVALGAALLPAHQGAAKPNDTIAVGALVVGLPDPDDPFSGPLVGDPLVRMIVLPTAAYDVGIPYARGQYPDEARQYHLHFTWHPEYLPLLEQAAHERPIPIFVEAFELHDPSHHVRGNGIHWEVHTLEFVRTIDDVFKVGGGAADPYCVNGVQCNANRGGQDKERT